MEIKRIVLGVEGLKAKGNLDLDIVGVKDASNNISKGDLFVAIKGFKTDGHKYINDAISKGAVAVIVEEGYNISEIENQEVTIIMCKDTRAALPIIASNFYEKPTKRLKVIGVTGTKGKTTTTYMIKEILEKAGRRVGLIGTIATYINGEKVKDNDRTTPESLELQGIFAKMVEKNVEIAIMEVSSQSLKLGRVDGVDFDLVAFTNFSKDHISPNEHPDMEDYLESKLKIFSMSKNAVVNIDDLQGNKLPRRFSEHNIIKYGIDNQADISARDITVTNAYSDFRVRVANQNERIKVGIPGRFSVYNSLAAIAIANFYGASNEAIKEALIDVRVPGRSELVDNELEIPIMIDYAHSPESLSNILQAAKNYTRGKVISVFGCGGDRDNSKRAMMGEISGKIADHTIITSDNPRTENPEEIVKEIEDGMKRTNGKYEVIVDRVSAIEKAMKIADKRDIVILAGKGHEPYQEINGVKHDFDERVIVNDLVQKLKNKKKK